MTKVKLQSHIAILDVKHGRKKLDKLTKQNEIPVTIKGVITGPWGHDDGVSQEFQVIVESVTTGEQS